MRTTVKICGITDSATAAFAFDQGADYVGLVLSESRRRVELTQARAITDEVPGAFVAVGKDVSEALFREMLALKVMAVQLHGRTPHDWIYRAHQADKMAIATQLQAIADVVLLDGPDPGSGVPRPWVRPLFKKPIWLAGGLTPENVNDVIRRLRPDGVDVSSGVERNGEKDYRLITNFIQEVHNGRKESS